MQNNFDELFDNFLKEYGQYYDLKVINMITEYYKKTKKDEYGTPQNLYTTFNELLQVYAKLGFYGSEQNDFFHKHLTKLQTNFDLDRNVLEIGGGPLAIFSNLIAYEQLKLGKGTVTVYDPRLIKKSIDYSNIFPYKRLFTQDVDVSEFDLIVGIYPCLGTELLIETACKYNKDFYVALCGCEHFPEDSYYFYVDDAPTYQEYLCGNARTLVREYGNGHLIIDELGDGIHRYPILYNKR